LKPAGVASPFPTHTNVYKKKLEDQLKVIMKANSQVHKKMKKVTECSIFSIFQSVTWSVW